MSGDGCELDLLWWLFHCINAYQIIMCSPETNMLYADFISVKKIK